MPTSRFSGLAGVLLLSHALAPPNLLAQYGGGPGDGHDHTTVMQLSLDGAPRGTNSLYAGGAGDGFDARAASAALGGQSLAVLYGGGRGDGFDALRVGLALSGQQLSVLYGGGGGDGFDALSTNRTLSGASLAMLYGGGSGDGFDVERESLSLGGATLAVLFGGGPGDGFDARRESFSLGGASLAALFGGGVGDGFDVGAFAGAVPLPLTLLAFGAEFTGDDLVLVTWTTTDERGTDFFVVERAADAVAFAELGEVEAVGQGLASGASDRLQFHRRRPARGHGLLPAADARRRWRGGVLRGRRALAASFGESRPLAIHPVPEPERRQRALRRARQPPGRPGPRGRGPRRPRATRLPRHGRLPRFG